MNRCANDHCNELVADPDSYCERCTADARDAVRDAYLETLS